MMMEYMKTPKTAERSLQMRIIRIDTWKKANKSALIQGLLSALFCIAYTYIVMIFTGGEEFVGKQPTQDMINGIRHDTVLCVCGVLAGLIPLMLLRYEKAKFLILYTPLSAAYYVMMVLLCVLFGIDDNFDLITYALLPVPIGSCAGTAIAILVNYFINKKQVN